ncbi:hypothetical protein EVJ58_g6465 [Rhodofomes roseus]|uniref:Pentatricopeptide repeat protein n=1 Tax=Rhodofomes roseus TaxID=34475 RepID=A0A4Y9YA79_9APHY|nr:hypothetical protein EVJ58_g6465 [Rhodofomes roseus]
MKDSFDVANERLDKLLAAPVEPTHYKHVAQMLAVHFTALYIHHSALSAFEILLQHWSGINSYLPEWLPVELLERARGDWRRLRERVADIVYREEQPTMTFVNWKPRMQQHQWQQVGEYLVDVFSEKSEGGVAFDIMETIKMQKLGVRVQLQLNVVKALVRDDLFEQANVLFASLAEHMGTDRAFDTYLEVGLYLHAHLGDVERAQEYYERLIQREQVSTRHVALLLHAHAVNGNANGATELFYHFFPPASSNSQVEPPNIYHYTSVVLAFARRADLSGMNTWLANMVKAGIAPDAHVYAIILKCLAQRGDLQHAAEVLAQMRASGVPPSRHAYTIMFTLLADRKDALAAEELYKQAIREQVVPDRVMIKTLMHVYVRASDWQGVVRTFDYLKSSSHLGIRLNIGVYNTLLQAYVSIGAPFRVVANLFQRIEETGLRPNAHTFALLIQSACDSGLMWIAKDLFAEMMRLRKDWQLHARTNVYIHTIMMAGWLRAGNTIRAKQVYDRMRKRGIQPSAATYAVIVKEYTRDRSGAGLQIAQEFIRTLVTADPEAQTWMKTSRSRRDALSTLYAPLLSAYARRERPEVVEELVAQMEQVGGSHSFRTDIQILDAYRRVGNSNAVRELWTRMYEDAVRRTQLNILITDSVKDSPPDLRSLGTTLCAPLSIYIDAMSAAGFHAEVAQTWAQLQKAKFVFDAHNWNHLAVALIRAGEPERAFRVVENIIIPVRQHLIRSVTGKRDRTPTSPILERPVDQVLEEDKESGDDMDPADKGPDGGVLTIPFQRPYTAERRARVAIAATRKGGDDLEVGKDNDFAHGLHMLYQKASTWHDWQPHTIVFAMLAEVLRHLSRGRLVQPVRPADAERDHAPTVQELRQRRAQASQILQRIYETCPQAVALLEKTTTRKGTARMKRAAGQIRRDSTVNY